MIASTYILAGPTLPEPWKASLDAATARLPCPKPNCRSESPARNGNPFPPVKDSNESIRPPELRRRQQEKCHLQSPPVTSSHLQSSPVTTTPGASKNSATVTAMAANWTHPDYDANAPAWARAHDVLAGEDAIKAAGPKCLPCLDSTQPFNPAYEPSISNYSSHQAAIDSSRPT